MKRSDRRTAPLTSRSRWALFTLYVWVTLMLPNVALSITEPIGPWGAMANLLLPGGFYMLALTLGRRVGPLVLWCFPLMFLAAFQMVLIDLFGRSPIATDMWLNLVTTNPSEAGNSSMVSAGLCCLS